MEDTFHIKPEQAGVREEIVENKEIIRHVIIFGSQHFKVEDDAASYFRQTENSATLHAKVPGSEWRVSIRASIVEDEVFFGITTIGGGFGYNTHLFTDIATPGLLNRYLEKSVQKIMEGIKQ